MISVIIPCYNQGRYLKEAIKSVIAQTYKDWEIIIINDGSTDNSRDVAFRFSSQDENILLYELDDVGASNARDFAIRKARGKYYIPLDADDKIEPRYMEKTLSILQKNDDLGFVYVDTIYFDQISSRVIPSPEYNFIRLIQGNFISYCSLFRRNAYFDCDGYDLNNFGYFEDYQLYINYGRRGWYGKHLAEPLFRYRVHPESSMQTGRTRSMGAVYNAYIKTQYPELYPVELVNQAKEILMPYKDNFMSSKTPQGELK